jgi:hypothetical protein
VARQPARVPAETGTADRTSRAGNAVQAGSRCDPIGGCEGANWRLTERRTGAGSTGDATTGRAGPDGDTGTTTSPIRRISAVIALDDHTAGTTARRHRASGPDRDRADPEP